MTLSEVYNHLLQRYNITVTGEMVTDFSDKGTRHSYIDVYNRILQPYHPAARILEIGVMTGGSLLLWDTWFDAAEITGIDLRQDFNRPQPWHDLLNQQHIQICWGVNSTRDSIFVPQRRFDVIIDDGSHRVADQLDTFRSYWHHVADGGVYIIEDIEDDESFETIMAYLSSRTPVLDTLNGYRVDYHQGKKDGRQDDQMIWIHKL